jgi:hypothetical protein
MPEPPVRLPDVARQVPRQAEEDPHETDVPEVPHPSMWFLALPIAFVAFGILMGVAFMTAGGDDEADAQPAVMAELPEGDLPSGPELVRVMELKELFRDAGQRVVPDSRGFEKTENCENNIDDDGDGLVDCSDPACAGTVDCAGHGGVGTGEIEGVD